MNSPKYNRTFHFPFSEGASNDDKIASDISEVIGKQIKYFMIQPSRCGGEMEGVVVRVANDFNDKDFSTSVFKMVRKNHVQTSEHWSNQSIIKNLIKK